MATIDDRLRELRELERTIREQQTETLNASGGGGTSGGVTDDWKANVDRQLEQLHGDVRNLLYGLIGGFLLAAGMIGGLYLRTDEKFAATRAEIAAVREGQIRLEAKIDALLDRKPAPGQ